MSLHKLKIIYHCIEQDALGEIGNITFGSAATALIYTS